LQRRFPIDDALLRSRDICDQVAKLSEIAPKFDVFGSPNFGVGGGKWPPKCLTAFHKPGSPSTTWQSLVTIGQATSEIRRRKKKIETAVKHNGAAASWPAAIKSREIANSSRSILGSKIRIVRETDLRNSG